MASPLTTFPLMDLPLEIVKHVLDNVDKSSLTAVRSAFTQLKKETDSRFYTTFFTEIESDLTQGKLQSLLWLSQQDHLASHVQSLSFAISDDYTAQPHHDLVNIVINNLRRHGSSITLGVASQDWDHLGFMNHCKRMAQFLNDVLVPHRDTAIVNAWKIVIRIDDLRLNRDMNLYDCFYDFARFVNVELDRDLASKDIELEIHDLSDESIRYIKVNKNAAARSQAILQNFDCDQLDLDQPNWSLDDCCFTDTWDTHTLIIKDSTFLVETLFFSMRRSSSRRRLVLENVRLRDFINTFDNVDIKAVDWIKTLRSLPLDQLQSCRFVNLYDANGDFFVEGVWEFTATPYQSVLNAITGLIENVERAHSSRDEDQI